MIIAAPTPVMTSAAPQRAMSQQRWPWGKLLLVLLLQCVAPLNAGAREDTDGEATMLNLEAEKPGGSIIGCLLPALRMVGVDRSASYLDGLLGSAFAFGMRQSGSQIHQAGAYQWSYFFDLLRPLRYSHIDASLRRIEGGSGEQPPAPPVSIEEHRAAKEQGWKRVRTAIDQGKPPIVWQPMTLEAKRSGVRPLPYGWGLIIGYDEAAETYTVHHSGVGTLDIRWDAFGHSDPVNWFSVLIFEPPPRDFNIQEIEDVSLRRAVASSKGEYPGVNADAHGLAAYQLWQEILERDSTCAHDATHHADFLIGARGNAAAFLQEVARGRPDPVRSHLLRAAQSYEEEVQALVGLRGLCNEAPDDIQAVTWKLSEATRFERTALTALQAVLEKL